jgi:opacity protein-like surface antigen
MIPVARLTTLILASALTCSLTGLKSRAADLLPPAPTLDQDVVELGTGWYLRGDVGYIDYLQPKDVPYGLLGTLPLDGEELDKTWSLGGGIGYQVTSWARADVTIDYRFGAAFGGTRPNPTYALGIIIDHAEVESTSALLNLYADLGTWSGVTPYLGAGIGIGYNRFTDISRKINALGLPPAVEVLAPHATYNLAWALMAGVSVDAGAGFKLDVGYRFTHLGEARTRLDGTAAGIRLDELQAHELRVGARYTID